MLHVELIHQQDLLLPHRLAHELLALLADHVVPGYISFVFIRLALQIQYVLLRGTGLQILPITKIETLRWKFGRH